ncbi:DEAD/DEAH box helicase [Microaerobacter geothermalis]|uniref:DEAD/DEAH box helicase n=1 Tax=Microaerobacter geothermalis TaxID=674972 RepID=UPI001F2A4D31|nr:DEAD/DEAH box helicase [Microaerobacter geothermalis]MCF6093151.1 DEAD/DEAH box helicase [Microaerobacter geothermalis]
MSLQFKELHLNSAILKGIEEMGFEEPSPIQEACIPEILKSRDVIGQAQTGTGKTAAFGIPLLQMISKESYIQGIILTPTRELAIQVSGEIRRIGRYKKVKILPIYGGQSFEQQVRVLRQGVHIVIGTPGRILDHLNRRTLDLSRVKHLILDEADEMLDMGFIEDIERIIHHINENRQTLLFSATMPAEILRLTRKYMKNPVHVKMNKGEVTVPTIAQEYYKVLESNKLDGLCRILDIEEVHQGIIFCRTKKGVDELTESLQTRGYLAEGLHGDLSQNQRDRVMKGFREGKMELLIATDVAARGIDVENVTHVINYDIPQDPESYVHRIGRTGRAGRKGKAITFVTPREMKHLKAIIQQTKAPIEAKMLPTMKEVSEHQIPVWKEQLDKVLANKDEEALTIFYDWIHQLESQYSLRDLAAAALRLAFYSDQVEGDEGQYDFGETGAKDGMVRFYLNIGRNENIRPKEFIHFLESETGISGNSIGRIDIFDRFTFVEIEEEFAPFVYESLKQSRFNDNKKIFIQPAKPKEKK